MKYVGMVATLLVVIGALNWGVVGIGMLMGQDLNLVSMLLPFSMELQAVVYLLVAASGLWVAYEWLMKMNKK